MKVKSHFTVYLHIYKKALKKQNKPSILCHHCVPFHFLRKIIHSSLSTLFDQNTLHYRQDNLIY